MVIKMAKEADLREQMIAEYRSEVEKYIKYLPWLQQKAGNQVLSLYNGDGLAAHSIAFPVYDGTLMNFIKEISKSKLIDKNYPYIYSGYRIHNLQDEKKIIMRATIRNMDILKGILSKYVLGGMTKGTLWSTAVQEGIFADVLIKMKELIEFWDKPLA